MTANLIGNIAESMTPSERIAYEAALAAPDNAREKRLDEFKARGWSNLTGAEKTEFERMIGILPDHSEIAHRRREDAGRGQ